MKRGNVIERQRLDEAMWRVRRHGLSNPDANVIPAFQAGK